MIDFSASQAQPTAVPVSVAVVEQRDVGLWDEFSGRLEAVERVEVRSRVAGAIKAVHFREGALVKEGDPLITIDPEPYAAEVDRTKAQVLAAEARLTLAQKEQDRARRLQQANSGAISESNVDQRVSAYREAEGEMLKVEHDVLLQLQEMLARYNSRWTKPETDNALIGMELPTIGTPSIVLELNEPWWRRWWRPGRTGERRAAALARLIESEFSAIAGTLVQTARTQLADSRWNGSNVSVCSGAFEWLGITFRQQEMGCLQSFLG